jgi:radical SAM protein with 4Fe4S-binding SPASM domain
MELGPNLARLNALAEERAVPMSALYELTGRCNLDCSHCYLDIAHPPPELTTAEAMRVIDELVQAGTMFLTLTGGELLLRHDALAIARHARRRGLSLRLFTNGTRVTRAIAAEIARLHPTAVEVSIYGAHAAAHDGVTRRRRTLRRSLRGILHLTRAGVAVRLKAPLLSPVIGELEALGALADRVGAQLAFDPFVAPRNDGDTAPLVLRTDSAALARALVHPRVLAESPLEILPPRDPDERPCVVGTSTVKIGPNGDVYPCVTYPEPVGNLRERPFAAIWAGGAVLDRLRALRVRDLEGSCSGCHQSGYCNRCTAIALIEHGNERGPSHEACRIAEARERAVGLAQAAAPRTNVRLRVVG